MHPPLKEVTDRMKTFPTSTPRPQRPAASLLCPVALASLLAATTGAMALAAPDAHAQPAGPSAARSYRIAPGPLGPALAAFAGQSGTTVAFTPEQTHALHTAGLQGVHGTTQALEQLLAGTGLQAVPREGGGYTLRRVAVGASTAAAATHTLAEMRVTAEAPRDGVTEGQDSYTTKAMATATPLALSIRETPHSVSVVTSELIKDRGVTTVQDAATYATGVSVAGVGPQRDSFMSRGSTVANITTDGLVFDHEFDSFALTGLAMYDRVEIVRGANGLMEGSGNASASINLVRKRPTRDFQGELTAAAGSWNNRLGTLDLSGPLNQDKTLRGRVVASANASDTFQQATRRQRDLLYAIVQADLSSRTQLTIGGSYNRDDNPGADYAGLPTQADGRFYDFDRSTRGSPVWSYFNRNNTTAFAELEHFFDNDWKIAFKGARLEGSTDILGASLWSRNANGSFAYDTRNYHMDFDSTSLDARASGPIQLLGRRHELALGINYRNRKQLYTGGSAAGGMAAYTYRFDPANWRDSTQVPEPAAWVLGYAGGYVDDLRIKQYGAFATAKFQLADPLHLFVGGRVSWYEYHDAIRSGSWSQTTAYKASAEITPYLALTYRLNDTYTAYASTTSIFMPQSYSSASGGLLDPVTGTNYEGGLKGEFFNGRLNGSMALFQINQENLPIQLDSSYCLRSSLSCYAQSGKVRSRGIEFDVSGELSAGWRVNAGYAYVNSQYLSNSTSGNAGDRYGTTTPRQILTLSTLYKPGGRLDGWRFGASARIQSEIHNTRTGFATVRQSGFGVANLTLGYEYSKSLDLQLNINNLFNRDYYRMVGSPVASNTRGEPRNVLMTARYRF